MITGESKMDHTMIDQGTHFSSYVMQLCSLLVAQGILRRVCLQGLVVSEKTFFFFFLYFFFVQLPRRMGIARLVVELDM